MRLLFDLDGTLTDSFVGITNCIQHALRTLGRNSPSANDLRWCIGPPLHASFLTLLETSDEQLADEAVEVYRDRFGTVGLFENEVYPGIPESLDALSQQGHVLSVATSKPTKFAVRIIEHFGLASHFCSVDGSQLNGIHTDKGRLIAHILNRDRIHSNSVLMIGDRKHDVIGAAENRVTAIGALWGNGSLEELRTAGARICVDAPRNLPGAIVEAEQIVAAQPAAQCTTT